MYIRVLGPLSIHHGKVEMMLSAQQPSTVLALLLLNNVRVVPVSELIDEIWKEAPPKTARTALRTYVCHLRKKLSQTTGRTLAEVAETTLQTVQNGYRFVAEPEQFDLDLYHRLQRAGTKAMIAGDFRSAAQCFHEALRLWRGPAVADVELGTRIRAEVAALEQSRMTMQDYRIELELRLGRHREILSELAVLTARNDFHENLHAQYMIALYRSGYRVRALEAFHKIRHNMLHELGLEPSLRLRKCHQAVLTLDPALDDAEVVPLPQRSPGNLPEIPALGGSF